MPVTRYSNEQFRAALAPSSMSAGGEVNNDAAGALPGSEPVSAGSAVVIPNEVMPMPQIPADVYGLSMPRPSGEGVSNAGRSPSSQSWYDKSCTDFGPS